VVLAAAAAVAAAMAGGHCWWKEVPQLVAGLAKRYCFHTRVNWQGRHGVKRSIARSTRCAIRYSPVGPGERTLTGHASSRGLCERVCVRH